MCIRDRSILSALYQTAPVSISSTFSPLEAFTASSTALYPIEIGSCVTEPNKIPFLIASIWIAPESKPTPMILSFPSFPPTALLAFIIDFAPNSLDP